MRKGEVLKHWQGLPDGINPLEIMRAIPYKTPGAKYGFDGIRIDGSPAFIDAVLGRLKPLLGGENAITRLELSRQPVKPKPGRDSRYPVGAECCYLRLHERGTEAKMVNAFASGIAGREVIISAGH